MTKQAYGQYCPVTKAAEILGERWTPLIVRNLLLRPHRFNELERGLPGISRSLLVQRLNHLERAGIVERKQTASGRSGEYCMTQAGRELEGVVNALAEWGARWAFGDPEPDDLDPGLLLWWMRDGIDGASLPGGRNVVQFDFQGQRTACYWLVIEPDEVSVCLEHPGFAIDLWVTADLAAWYKVWLGRITLGQAMRDGLVELEGPSNLVRAFPRCLKLSPFSGFVRAAQSSTSH
ncbi:MAG: helix-turn-helix transcriptional regulator [Anaerolineae bacterium]|nr:helix-turn-helix transcriptional regulator [Anaerolineae bacterium]